MMTPYRLDEIEEYSPSKFVAKKVYEGAQCKTMLLHLLPGQTVPVHPHPGFEVALAPQKGECALVWEDGAEQTAKPGVVYYGGVNPIFGLENRGLEPFQTLVILTRCDQVGK